MNLYCLGGSLTAGYPGYSPSQKKISNGEGIVESQYEYWLEKLIKENFDKISSLRIINKGMYGEISSDLLKRINRDIIQTILTPDRCIIIIGTNDLFSKTSIEDILKNIKSLHEICHEHNIPTIGATIPPIQNEQEKEDYKEKKMTLNMQLESYFIQKNIPYCDLFNGMMDENGNLDEIFAVSDGIHFSVEGYKKMAKLIFYQALKEQLE